MLELSAERARLLDFARGSVHPEGGFGWLRVDGSLDLSRRRELWINTRMTYVFARAGETELVEHGLAALREDFRDPEHGGWFSVAGEPGDKKAYEHVFVVLAAAAAGDADLLAEALEVLETRFWEERFGALADVCSRDWSAVEPYRGANANMHGVEAMVATGDPLWVERASRITERFVGGVRVIEHYDPSWRPLPHYNRDDPAHPFRPYGSTPGHGFEWARLAHGLGFEAEAQRLFAGAVHDGWDGSGFLYTVDFDGRPVVRARLHWVLCEAIAAAAVLGEREFERAWWELAEQHFIDREGGSWWHELDTDNRPASTIWDGKPDVYHALTAVTQALPS
ncbi:AGE family epimerase/isomerase [Solirubrobacter sp. CPCC 204708]|uniref:AGE family epimerase/isomerase n=1 Tax=Solirubrobacter deserti TaxID=2282478 RepID=A0ABT4RLX7_9ACTN|nr:AGE family epimerase/isomerase [Solirubrobacter deserti]MBE2314429.1 AGE family epimerase/isomerase [Solirubrobacter deserti]MDA0139575.1 AGE family epimerase/isomerase [Solirubrobacter deserti]